MQTELFKHAPSLHDKYKFLHSIYALRSNESPLLQHINTIFEGYNDDDEVLESCEKAHCIYVKVNNEQELHDAISWHKGRTKRVRLLVAFKFELPK